MIFNKRKIGRVLGLLTIAFIKQKKEYRELVFLIGLILQTYIEFVAVVDLNIVDESVALSANWNNSVFVRIIRYSNLRVWISQLSSQLFLLFTLIFFVFHVITVAGYTPTMGELALSDLVEGYWARFATRGGPATICGTLSANIEPPGTSR